MNFEDYKGAYEAIPLCQTEQSQTFLVQRDGIKVVCKRFPSSIERAREEITYRYLVEEDVINIPRLFMFGEDFLEFEFIEKVRDPEDIEIINEISRLYLKTLDNAPSFLLSRPDLTRERIFYRLSYLKEEFTKSGNSEEGILEKAKRFVQRNYDLSQHLCVVHGDLKSPHCIPSSQGLFFIDFGITVIANPWYDLAYLYLEKKDKTGLLERFTRMAYETLGDTLNVNEEQIWQYLRSGIFYRSLYYLGFALRHRPKKSIERAKMELTKIIKETK